MMPEAFLHYIWQFQYFDKRNLLTTVGDHIEIVHPGYLNPHAGPDFEQAQLLMAGMAWAGSVEIHLKSSDWHHHGHQSDTAYEQVVLHVVWEDDATVVRSDGSPLPTLELKGRIDTSMLSRYGKLVGNPATIACQRSFGDVPEVVKRAMLDRALVQRLEEKADWVTAIYHHNKGNWEETAYQVLARNFGFKINSDPFHELAKVLPLRILQKHCNQPVQVEALLYGQAGFLEEEVGDTYYQLLRREYHVLCTKYNLTAGRLRRSRWRFLRLRPANFPTVRIAQFAALVSRYPHWLSGVLESHDFSELRKMIVLEQSTYWQSHYQFNRATKHRLAGLGDSSVENVLINPRIVIRK